MASSTVKTYLPGKLPSNGGCLEEPAGLRRGDPDAGLVRQGERQHRQGPALHTAVPTRPHCPGTAQYRAPPASVRPPVIAIRKAVEYADGVF